MAKARNTAFFCKECGYESAKWLGQCPVCKEWNTFVEEPVAQAKKAPSGQIAAVGAGKTAVPVHISEISLDEQDRTPTGFGELDRVLGSGIVKGSLVLVGGDRGSESRRCFYRSAETSPGRENVSSISPVRNP